MTQISNEPTIKDFLLARIDEDEKLAKEASEPSPNWDRGTEETGDGENIYYVVEPVRPYVRDVWIADLENTGRDGRAHGDHIARHDPARVLRECVAKRAIIEAHDPDNYETDLYVSEPLLCALASIYSDHPDYRQEWALNG